MSKLNRTFQRLRREKRINFFDVSEKCNIPISRIEELDNDADFTNSELVSICDVLGLSVENFIKEADSTRMDFPFRIKMKIEGDPKESELYEVIRDIELERMNNIYDPECQGWKHNSFNEAVAVLENAKNELSCMGFVPPSFSRMGYLFACLTYIDDHAYIEGIGVASINFDSEEDSQYRSMDLMIDPYDDMDDFDYFDNGRY